MPDEVPGETPRLTLSGRGSSLPHNDSWGGEVPTPLHSGLVAVPVGAGGSATAHGRGSALPEWGGSHSSGRAGGAAPPGWRGSSRHPKGHHKSRRLGFAKYHAGGVSRPDAMHRAECTSTLLPRFHKMLVLASIRIPALVFTILAPCPSSI